MYSKAIKNRHTRNNSRGRGLQNYVSCDMMYEVYSILKKGGLVSRLVRLLDCLLERLRVGETT